MIMPGNDVSKRFVLAAVLTCAFVCGCHTDKPSNEEEAEAQALKFAQAYFNFDYAGARKLCDDSSAVRMDFYVSNLTKQDLDTIRNLPERPNVEILKVRKGDTDETAVALCRVENAFVLDTLGRTGHMVDRGEYKINLIKREGQWKIRMAGLLQSGK